MIVAKFKEVKTGSNWQNFLRKAMAKKKGLFFQ
jgi:hypothetical protein